VVVAGLHQHTDPCRDTSPGTGRHSYQARCPTASPAWISSGSSGVTALAA
jgi:hypothetical protein